MLVEMAHAEGFAVDDSYRRASTVYSELYRFRVTRDNYILQVFLNAADAVHKSSPASRSPSSIDIL